MMRVIASNGIVAGRGNPRTPRVSTGPVLDNLFNLFLPTSTNIAAHVDDAIIAVLLAIPKHPDTRMSPQWTTR